MSLTTAQKTAWTAELATDPLSIGWAALVHTANDAVIASMANAMNYTMAQPIPMASVLTFGAQTGVLAKVQANVASATVVGTTTLGAICTGVMLMLQGPAATTLDITDPTITTMLAALVTAGVLTNSDNSSAQPALVALGTVPASRFMVVCGYGLSLSAADNGGCR